MKDYFQEPDRALTLSIERAGKPMKITFMPRIGSVEGREWRAVDSPDGGLARCR